MGWHRLSPSVIKHGAAVTLWHPRQAGRNNEAVSMGSAVGGWHGWGNGASKRLAGAGADKVRDSQAWAQGCPCLICAPLLNPVEK